jgi:hypothetical protein
MATGAAFIPHTAAARPIHRAETTIERPRDTRREAAPDLAAQGTSARRSTAEVDDRVDCCPGAAVEHAASACQDYGLAGAAAVTEDNADADLAHVSNLLRSERAGLPVSNPPPGTLREGPFVNEDIGRAHENENSAGQPEVAPLFTAAPVHRFGDRFTEGGDLPSIRQAHDRRSGRHSCSAHACSERAGDRLRVVRVQDRPRLNPLATRCGDCRASYTTEHHRSLTRHG